MELQTAQVAINNAKRIAIMGHLGGDADCYGAAFGLAVGLQNLGKIASVIVGDEYPDSLDYLFFYYSGEIVKSMEKPDLLLLIDSSDLNRISDSQLVKKYKGEGVKTLLLDHHIPGDLEKYVDISVVDTKASSTSEIVYNLLIQLDTQIDKNIATCLLAGIISDTSSFQNQNTTKESFAIASELMKRGARLHSIVNNTFGGKEVDVLKIWGLAMERLITNKRYGAVITYITHEDIETHGLSADVLSGVVNFLNSIKGARMVVLITEEEKGTVKVSLRTRDEHVDVSKITRQLGGGGHAKASGFSIPGSLKILTEGSNNHIVIV